MHIQEYTTLIPDVVHYMDVQ